MAYTIDTIRKSIVTSLFGRRFGIVRPVIGDTDSEHLGGIQGVNLSITDATSDTTGTPISCYGVTVVDTSTDDGWTLNPPRAGILKTIFTGSTSTGIRTIKRADATFAINTSASSTNTTIVAQAGGLILQLLGISSTAYVVVSRPTGMSSACSTEMAFNGTT